MRILLIGGTGLISTAITRLLLERGADDLTLSNRGKTEVRFLHSVPHTIKVIQGDRTNFAAFEQQMQEAGTFDCVIDMCCYLPDEAESVVHAFSGRIGQYIFTSTVDVYTKPAARYPITEQAERQPDPAFAYAYHKAACEEILQAAHNNSDFFVTIIRPAYTYGEGRGPIHTLGGSTMYLDRLRKGKPIVVHGDGSSFWGACYRDDVARAFVQAAGQAHTFGRAYHVTGEEWMTWNQYHQRVAAALRVNGVVVASRANDVDADAEYRFKAADEPLLRSIASMTGGVYQPTPADVARHDARRAVTSRDVAPWFLTAALGLWLMDILLRRVRVFE